MDTNNDSIFDDKLIDYFSSDGFYARPKKTKIKFKFGDDGNESIIGNGIVMNLEETNEKIPVYSYNADIYTKYLNGKKIVTGAIALRKITIASFLNLIKKNNLETEMNQELSEIEESINELLKEKSSDSLYKELVNELKKEQVKIKEQYLKKQEMDIFDITDINQFSNNEELLYYTDNDANLGKNINIIIEYEGNLQSVTTQIKDVLFVKKNTEININKNDIIEVYQFIGNPVG